MTPAKSITFHSPISMEGSWGVRPLAKRAKCTMALYFNKDGSGYIEWEVPHFELYEEIGLTFEYDNAGKRTLVDYDGVMTLPDQALDLLESVGVDVTEMRKSLSE